LLKRPLFMGFYIFASMLLQWSSVPLSAQEMGSKDKAKSGGNTTRTTMNRMSFSLPSANMPKDKVREFFFGNRLFNTNWVTAPASVKSFDGLGRLFNRVSCSGCHLRDGRGRPPAIKGAPMQSMLLRLSIPGKNKHGGPKPLPGYGGQLNDRAISGVTPEGQVVISYSEIQGKFEDGTVYSLRQPKYSFKNLGYGPMPKDLLISPRVAPAVFGLGLLEAIPESYIFGRADPNNKNMDGISGKANMVWDQEAGNMRLGRFGWKANQPSLKQQNAGAFLGDVGITSDLFIDENCAEKKKQCQQEITGGRPEISEAFLKNWNFILKAWRCQLAEISRILVLGGVKKYLLQQIAPVATHQACQRASIKIQCWLIRIFSLLPIYCSTIWERI
jgi:CxxC motif-containing protein (DUF1111 family)